MNYQLISEAIVRYVNGSLPKTTDKEIADSYGEETAREVRAVYEKAMNCPVDWSSPEMTMDIALGALADLMAKEFPELSPEARTRLNYCFIMCWK